MLYGFILIIACGFLSAADLDFPEWSEPFKKAENLYGSYSSCVVRNNNIEVWNNAKYQTLDGGITVFTGKEWDKFDKGKVVAPNRIINDLFDKDNKPHPSRMFTRPMVCFSKKDNMYYSISHVSKGYPPEKGRVYPAFLTSKTGEKGDWRYHGMLKGEIWDEFGPGKKNIWSSGLGFVINDNLSNKCDHENPVNNRFLFYTDDYSKGGALNLLYSNNGEKWFFARDKKTKKILDLRPAQIKKVNVNFPSVIKTENGFHCYLTEGWPPNGIWHLFSKDGLNWKVWNNSTEPEIPRKQHLKNMSLYYDSANKTVHGLLTVCEKSKYNKYHSKLKIKASKNSLLLTVTEQNNNEIKIK